MNKCHAYGLAGGVGGSLIFPGPLVTGAVGLGLWAMSKSKCYKDAGVGVVIGTVGTVVVAVTVLAYALPWLAGYKVIAYPTSYVVMKGR